MTLMSVFSGTERVTDRRRAELFGNAPPNQARLLSMHIYVNSFVNWNLGLGAAMSVLALMAASLLYLRIVVGGRTQHA